jgi:hypothetical protein
VGPLLLLAVLAAAVTVPVGSATAQTPDEVCAADTLYLISPESVDLRLESSGKPGLTVRWPTLDPSLATCFSLARAEGLNFEVDVSGGFGDDVDRLFRFTTADSGIIGARNVGNLTVTWQNQGPATNGNIGGIFNLSNNGGVVSYGATGDTWDQFNTGLPMTWQRTNTVALDRGSGSFMVAAFTGGLPLESASRGVYTYNGTNWERLAADLFGSSVGITAVAISAGDDNSFAVGTASNGLYVTNDGGVTFTQWTTELDPAGQNLPTVFRVSALNWESDRLLVYMPNWGLFTSTDDGVTFSRSPIEVRSNLDVPTSPMALPTIREFAVDPSNPDRIVAALEFHGAFETTDGCVSWHDLYGDLVVPDPDPDIDGAWVNSAQSILIEATDPQIIVMGVSQKGLFRTTDGGVTWIRVGTEAGVQPENVANLTRFAIVPRTGRPGEILAMENGWALLHSVDAGATWSQFATQPPLNKGVVIVPHRDSSGDFTLGTNGGGIYESGTTLRLTETYTTITSPELRQLDLGLEVTFDAGQMLRNDSFDLVAQTFQGWAVWRGPGADPDNMKLIGLYDRVNPEDCFEGYCGDNSLEIIPQCFAAKRAACFNLSDPDTIRFFDEEVYNGFSYVYAISSFDYGNTALTTAENNTNEILFSPRWDRDTLSPFTGGGNRTRVDVNAPAAADLRDEEIYAFPNPVRLGAGLPRGEGELVVFTNLPAGARVRVFTTAGDDVIDLGPETQTGGQIYWNTANDSGAAISAGIYLYKVEMPQRDDYWGRLVVIR